MATLAATHTDDNPMTPGHALRRSWVIYLTLLLIPFLVAMGLIFYLLTTDADAVNGRLNQGVFIAAMAWIIVALPAGFWIRYRLFQPYYQGQPVPPRNYLLGMLAIWLPLEIGSLMGLLGAFLGNSPTPNMIPAVLAFVLLTPFWPVGHAMSRPEGGNKDDFELYKEPR